MDSALLPDVLRGVDHSALAQWLVTRRWYGGKKQTPGLIRIAWVIHVAQARTTVMGVEVESRGGRSTTWQVPVTLGDEHEADAIVVVAGCDGRAALVDAMGSARWREWLLKLIASGEKIAGHDAEMSGETVLAARELLGGDQSRSSRLLGAEQSNTSVLYGDVAILKLFRRLEAGVHPDIEVTRALDGRGAPRLLGALWLGTNDGREPMAAAIVQQQVARARDGWSYALEAGRRDVAAAHAPPSFGEEARRIGSTTREMHDALASVPDPAFETREAGERDLAQWARNVTRAATHALALLDDTAAAQTGIDAAHRARITNAADGLGTRLAGRVNGDAGHIMRHHGDLHLGQVLRSVDGAYAVIDFEGEPVRPLEERRLRSSPLRDVAGMLRSISYASATLAHEGAEPASVAAWERNVRAAYLDGYLEANQPAYLPRSPESRDALIELFEAEKIFYELAYEVENRPNWVDIPLRGVRALVGAST